MFLVSLYKPGFFMHSRMLSRMFVHTCMWLPVVRRKASTGSHIARLAHQLRFHDRDMKANAVKAVTALHPKTATLSQM